MATYFYTAPANLDGDLLRLELDAAGVPLPPPPDGISLNGSQLALTFPSDLDAAQQATVANVVAAHNPTPKTPEEVMRERALAIFNDPQTFDQHAVSVGLKVLRKRDADTAAKINGLIDHINALRTRLINNGQNMTGVPNIPESQKMTAWTAQEALDAVVAQLLLDIP